MTVAVKRTKRAPAREVSPSPTRLRPVAPPVDEELLQSLPVACVSFDAHGLIRNVNVEMTRLVGLGREYLLGLPLPALIVSTDIPLFLSFLAQCRAQPGVRATCKLRLSAANGETVWVELLTVPMLHAGVVLLRTAIIDITDRLAREESVIQEKKHAEQLFDFVPQPLLVVDHQLLVVETNSAFLQQFRCARREAIGRRLQDVDYIRWEGPALFAALRHVVHTGEPVRDVECEAVFPGIGTRLVLLVSARRSARLVGGPPGILVSFEDVTERRQQENIREGLMAKLQHLANDLERRVAVRTSQLNEANARLRTLSRRIVNAQEAERRHLARELHDEIGQALTGLRMTLDRLQSHDGSPGVRNAQKIVDGLLVTVRELMTNLRPHVLDNLGLAAALQWHIKNFSRQTHVRITLTLHDVSRDLPIEVGLTAFRVVQEALTNVARHAAIRSARVLVEKDGHRLRIEVTDKGAGFESGQVPLDRSGLSNMRERVLLAGGTFELESRPKRGTKLQVTLPMECRPSHEPATNQPRTSHEPATN